MIEPLKIGVCYHLKFPNDRYFYTYKLLAVTYTDKECGRMYVFQNCFFPDSVKKVYIKQLETYVQFKQSRCDRQENGGFALCSLISQS